MNNRKKLLLGIVCLLMVVGTGCDSLRSRSGYSIQYFYTQTEDGLVLCLRRYEPKTLDANKNPVILCHGLGYNLLFWDLADKVSLPAYLARNGYDVWSLSLRGAAPSSQPLASSLRKLGRFNLEQEMLKTMQKRVADVKMVDWSVDDHIRYDVPAALRYVREQTGYEKVHWIGHSMGGMVMFAYLGQGGVEAAAPVKSFVAAAVPMAVFHPLSEPFKFMLDAQPALGIGSKIVGSSAPATAGLIFGDMNTEIDKLFYNGKNVGEDVIRNLFRLAQEEISPGQLNQLLEMVRNERFRSLDKTTDYTALLPAVVTPTYFMVGTVDNMATVGAVQYAYREVASENKRFGLFGRVNGHKNDYGHDDIIIGQNALKEVYPTIVEWLNPFSVDVDETRLLLQPKEIK
jgi:lysosomal acid lipase/cholesteryl ester hydrolase